MVSSGKNAWLAHAVLMLGLAVVLFPVYVGFVASSLPLADILDAPMTLVPGQNPQPITARRSLWERVAACRFEHRGR